MVASACSGSGNADGRGSGDPTQVVIPPAGSTTNGAPGSSTTLGGDPSQVPPASSDQPLPGNGSDPSLLPVAGSGAAPVAGNDALPMAGMGALTPPADTMLPPPGPDMGDPATPVVEAPGVACGTNPSLFGLTTTNATIGGRDVYMAYPCNLHSGAPVTFVLNLHGTMSDESLKLYQVAYFSINNYAQTHNIITAAPKSVVSQWGNGDGGQDLPHIMNVIDYVYTTFADLDIRQMWIAGHSWGAMYSTNLVCSPDLADKVRGAVLSSGSGQNPACADRLSVISTAAENDIGPVIDQGGIPGSHGCGAPQTNMVGNNVETYWPDCMPGRVHANYFMLGKQHADYIDDEVVHRIADLILLARP